MDRPIIVQEWDCWVVQPTGQVEYITLYRFAITTDYFSFQGDIQASLLCDDESEPGDERTKYIDRPSCHSNGFLLLNLPILHFKFVPISLIDGPDRGPNLMAY